MNGADRLAICREICKRSLKGFVRLFWKTLEPTTPLAWGWALDAICDHLEAISRGEVKRLVINVPPGSMKSLLVSVFWPAWEWATINPSKAFLSTANNQKLSERDARKMRLLVTSELYRALFPHVRLTADQAAKTNFENTLRGRRNSVAFNGITGFRGDTVIIDDPISVKGLDADAKRKEANTLFREALPSRVNNDSSSIVMIMQRIHEEDPAAIALSLGYEHLIIPAKYEGPIYNTPRFTDPRTVEGQNFFPERFSDDQLSQLERSLGAYAWAAQYQQRPAPAAGGLLKPEKIQIVEAIPSGLNHVCRGWDFAATEGAGDYTAGCKVAIAPDGSIYILDLVFGQWNPGKVKEMLAMTARADGYLVHQSLPQDPGAAGKAMTMEYARCLLGSPHSFTPEQGKKDARAMPLAGQIEAGNVRMVRAEWNKVLSDQMISFPVGRHDDLIDSLTRAYNHLVSSQPIIDFSKLI